MKNKFSFNKLSVGIAMLFIPKILSSQQPTSDPDSVEMVRISGGTFEMGSKIGESYEKPIHTVTISTFYMGKYEVTVEQFQEFINETGQLTTADIDGGSFIIIDETVSKQSGVNWSCDAEGKKRLKNEYNHPVIHVSWFDCVEYCKWLSRKTGKNYRLPTEAEWEYTAGNAAKHTRYSWGNDYPDGKGGNLANKFLRGNLLNDGYVFTSPVGSYNPNELGVYDMTGNVSEYCSDWFDKKYYKSSPSNDPQGPSTGILRVIRGGCWGNDWYAGRSSYRVYIDPRARTSIIGFRIARSD